MRQFLSLQFFKKSAKSFVIFHQLFQKVFLQFLNKMARLLEGFFTLIVKTTFEEICEKNIEIAKVIVIMKLSIYSSTTGFHH